MAKAQILDLTRGFYRRIYSGFIGGKRINSVSLDAEAWFWRINAVADDFGNLDGDPGMVFANTVGRRSGVTVAKVAAWVDELVKVELLNRYDVGGESFLHVAGFIELQPKGKNGRQVRRVPPPDDDSGGIRGNPGDSISTSISTSISKPAAQAGGEPAGTRTSPPPVPVLIFPVCGVRGSGPAEWPLTAEHVAELTEAFPGVDVLAECRKALVWVNAKPRNKKTSGGMREFLFRWMSREQNQNRGNPNVRTKPTPEQRGLYPAAESELPSRRSGR